MESSRLHSDMIEQILEQGKLASCVVITFQVMAVAGVSPGNPDAVDAAPEGSEDELGAHPGRAGHPDDPDIRWILEAAHACQVCRAVATPVAKESRYFRLPVVHRLSPFYLSPILSLLYVLFYPVSSPLGLVPRLHLVDHGHDLPFLKAFEVEGP